MKRLLCLVAVVAMILTGGVAGAAVTVDVYSGHGTTGGGAPYSGLVGSFTSPDIMFATNTGFDWHPFGLADFGADITGSLIVGAAGNYQFTLTSDDGSLLYIDGALVVDNGGGHSPQSIADDAYLTAGLHLFEVQFFEDFGGPSGIDLYLPAGVSYADAVPEPSTLLLLGGGLVGLAGYGRKLRKQAV